MQGREFGEGGVVGFDFVECHGASVAGDVIGAGEDHDDFWLQVDDVLAKTHEHLWSRLATDAAIDVGLAGKGFVEVRHVGDGVSEEDYAVVAGRRRRKRWVW